MHDNNHDSRPVGGDASSACDCGALAHPPRPGVTEQHADDCAVFDESRALRARDLADLAERPPGWTVVRALADVEVREAEDTTGAVIPAGRRARRRWTVEVRSARLGGRVALARVFRLDGEPRGVIVDETPAPAGAR